MSRTVSFLVAFLLSCPAFQAAAQDDSVVRLNSERAKRLDKASELARDKAYAEALEIYDGLLAEVSFDLLFLNRGRILQKLGRCEAALTAFEKVPGAPSLEGVGKETIMGPLGRYTAELEETCPGKLAVSCGQAEMALSIEGQADKKPVCGEPIELPAGDWEIKGTLHGQTVRTSATVKGTRTVTASLSLGPPELTRGGRVLLGQSQFAAAQVLLEEALRAKETQEIYLYIAEALMGQGKCQLAYVSIEQVAGAPSSSALSPLQLAQQLDVFQKAFREVCGELVRVRCAPAEMTLRIDDGPPQVCSPAPIFLSAGPHQIVGSVPGGEGEPPLTLAREVSIKAGEVNQVELVLSEEAVFGALGWTGLAGVSVGVASLISAVAVDRFVLVPLDETFERDKRNGVPVDILAGQLDDIETYQSTNAVLTAVGLSLVVLGSGMMVADVFFLDDEGPGVSLEANSDRVLVMWGMPWP